MLQIYVIVSIILLVNTIALGDSASSVALEVMKADKVGALLRVVVEALMLLMLLWLLLLGEDDRDDADCLHILTYSEMVAASMSF